MTEPVVEKTLADYEIATRTRDAIQKMAQDALGTPQPMGMIARVIDVNPDTLKAHVWLPGDDAPIEVNILPDHIPYEYEAKYQIPAGQTSSTEGRGARVWVERINDKLFITEVFSGGVFRKASGTFEDYVESPGPDSGTAGQAWSVRTGATLSCTVPLPPTGQCVTFGPFGGALGEGFTEISVTDKVFGTSKTYHFAGLANQALLSSPGRYEELVPRYVNFAEDTETNRGDFELEIGNEQLTPTNSTVAETHLMLRIRRKGDNNSGAQGNKDGYRVVIRSHHGITGGAPANVPFRTVVATAAVATDVYGTTAFSFTNQLPLSGQYDSPAIDFPRRVQHLVSAGGAIVWDGQNLSFGSFKLMFTGRHTHTFSFGEQYVDMPAQGTSITVVGDTETTTKAVGSLGINLLPGEALYYALDPGGPSTSDASKFRIVNSEKITGVPYHWVFLAGSTGAYPSLKIGTGEQYDHRRTPDLASGWSEYGGAYEPPCYYMGAGRIVHIEGFFKRTSGTTAQTTAVTLFTLPTGFRPRAAKVFGQACGLSNISPARVDVLANGAVQLVYAGATNWVTLENMQFRAFQ